MSVVAQIALMAANGGGIDAFAKLCAHFKGSDGAATFADASFARRSLIGFGNAQIDAAESRFGGASLLLDGTNSGVYAADSPDWAFGSENFTVDCWIRLSAIGLSQAIVGCWETGGGDNRAWLLFANSSNRLQIICLGSSGTTVIDLTGTTTLAGNTWYHVAAERNGSNAYLYLNGLVDVSSTTISGLLNDSPRSLLIGAQWANAAEDTAAVVNELNGWIEELRISKGVARYGGSNFTPPTATYF